jgi:hypothetical protein
MCSCNKESPFFLFFSPSYYLGYVLAVTIQFLGNKITRLIEQELHE